MRKWNALLSLAALLLLLAHGILGSFQMIGAGNSAVKALAWAALALLVIHGILGIKFTWDSIRVWRKTGVSYYRENRLFWTRRISGFVLLILLFFHVTALGYDDGGVYRLQWFTAVKLALHLMLAAALGIHLITNVRPLMIALGLRGGRKWLTDVFFVLSVLLLFMAVAFVVYYIRWNVF